MPLDEPSQIYRPEQLPRRGEWIAWSMSGLVGLTWAVLVFTGRDVPRAVPWFTVILLLAASGISLSNWMDRKSCIQLLPEGVIFDNGLRHTELAYHDIREVQVFQSQWGKKVRVIGPSSLFTFRTLGEVRVQDEIKGRMGFVNGELILKTIIRLGNLKKVKDTGNGYYYARD